MNIGTIRKSLRCEIYLEMGIVPFIDIVPVLQKELIIFLLVLIDARKCERCFQTKLDIIHLFEIALYAEHRLGVYS